jgi:hypothetical protein
MSDTISIKLKEYDLWDGCTQCVLNETFPATWLGSTERTVRNLLAGGDYSEGSDNRYVEAYKADGSYIGMYTAPRIRRFKHRTGTL